MIFTKTSIILLLLIFVGNALSQTKIDEFGKSTGSIIRGHLLDAGWKVYREKNTKLYILIHKERKQPVGEFLRYYYAFRDFYKFHKLSDEMVVISIGDEREEKLTELWLVKEGEKPPFTAIQPLPELTKIKVDKKLLFDIACVACDGSEFEYQNVWEEGFDYIAMVMNYNPDSRLSIKIGKNGYVARTLTEKRQLVNDTLHHLKRKKINKGRVSVEFIRGGLAFFYIVPARQKSK